MQARLRWMAAGLWVTACGPLPPESDSAGEQTSTTTSTTTGDPSTEPGTTAPTTTATATSGTSGPAPECQSDADCDGFCEYCVDGECYDAVGCCGLAPNSRGEPGLRCQGYECYGDDDCDDGEACDGLFGGCEPIPAIPLCDRQPLTLSAIPLQGAASAVALADLDGDATLDLVAALPEQGQVEVQLGDGAGGFSPGTLFATELTGPGQQLAIADFDGDGSPDLALTIPSAVGELRLLFGQDALFSPPVTDTLGLAPRRLWAGDFDGDGRPDLLTHGDAPEQPLTLRAGDGMGGFGPASDVPALAGTTFAAAVGQAAGDPARLDVAVTLAAGPGADLYEFPQGLGPVASLVAPGEAPTTSLAVGDVDGDGQDDVVGHRAPGGLELLQVWSMQQAQPELRVEGTVRLGPIGDVDGDGAGDLVADGGPGTVRVIFVAGGPCVQDHAFADAAVPELLAVGDVDGDGKADVIAGAASPASLALLRSGP